MKKVIYCLLLLSFLPAIAVAQKGERLRCPEGSYRVAAAPGESCGYLINGFCPIPGTQYVRGFCYSITQAQCPEGSTFIFPGSEDGINACWHETAAPRQYGNEW